MLIRQTFRLQACRREEGRILSLHVMNEAMKERVVLLAEASMLLVSIVWYLSNGVEVTESRISQLHTKAIIRLKAKLTSYRKGIF